MNYLIRETNMMEPQPHSLPPKAATPQHELATPALRVDPEQGQACASSVGHRDIRSDRACGHECQPGCKGHVISKRAGESQGVEYADDRPAASRVVVDRGGRSNRAQRTDVDDLQDART